MSLLSSSIETISNFLVFKLMSWIKSKISQYANPAPIITIGVILSFYLDYQANESFLDTAAEFENILKIGKQVGFKFLNTNSSTGIATFYINVPAATYALGPDLSYAPVLKKGSSFSTKSGAKFILNQDVRFDNPRNETTTILTLFFISSLVFCHFSYNCVI